MKTFSVKTGLSIYKNDEHDYLFGDLINIEKSNEFLNSVINEISRNSERILSSDNHNYELTETVLSIAKEMFGDPIPAEIVFLSGMIVSSFFESQEVDIALN